jgi:hypothetical protein
LLHDTNVREREFGVFRLWAELQLRWPGFEFVHGYGLGILGVGADLPARVQRLFQTSPRTEVTSAIRSVYATLGSVMRARIDKEQLAHFQSELGQRTVRISQLEDEVVQQQSKLERLNLESRANEEKVVQQQSELERLNLESRTNEEKIAILEHALVQGGSNISYLERRIESLRTSRSWRVTAPLRWFDHLFSWKEGLWSNLKDEAIVFFWRIAIRFPVFHGARALKYQSDRLTEEHLFDSQWYRSQFDGMPGVADHPLVHYLTVGVERSCDPNPLFDTTWYLQNYPEVAVARVNPLFHYIEFGAKLGFNPGPLFDSNFYLAQHPEATAAGINPLRHYLLELRQKSLLSAGH